MTDTDLTQYEPLYKAFKACYKEYGKEDAEAIISWILDRFNKETKGVQL